MSWRERRLTRGFGVELSGARLGPELSAADRLEIGAAAGRYGVVVLPDQELSDEDLHAFAASLGEVALLPSAAGVAPMSVARLTNLDAEGNLLPPDDWMLRQGRANDFWHTDSTYVRPRATLSMLYAQRVPPVGGDTEFCDTRLAYEALSAPERSRLEGLRASHSLIHSRRLAGFSDWTEEDLVRFAPVERPLVQLHAESGRRALCLASHISGIVGMDAGASAALLGELMALASVPERCHAHRWRAGDLVIWDNRCTMHRATPFDGSRWARDMRTVRLVDVADAA